MLLLITPLVICWEICEGPKGILINIGRGAHVDESELVAALIEGRIGGAGLDVYQTEPEVPEQLDLRMLFYCPILQVIQ
ncbi:hypothetical protein H5410_062416 [Solanum commersonii]|uniref:D-isomer specific 2-hydroxyacid dehydrogenase NAD-binding domain-containing protein n=1 Tax=Solanum commersonii TaxID=4109 RepID=A0A9J5WAT0_SOLCO|nr:hypothetical protein H5410_062416 [Solanum commersonii]